VRVVKKQRGARVACAVAAQACVYAGASGFPRCRYRRFQVFATRQELLIRYAARCYATPFSDDMIFYARFRSLFATLSFDTHMMSAGRLMLPHAVIDSFMFRGAP